MNGYFRGLRGPDQVWPPATVGCLNNGGILRVRTQLSYILAVCILILVKIFLITEENDVVCIGWFTLARKAFSTTAQVAYTVHIVFNIKTVWLHYVILEMHSFPMSAAKHFYENPLSIYLDPKIVLIYRSHPAHILMLKFISAHTKVLILYIGLQKMSLFQIF